MLRSVTEQSYPQLCEGVGKNLSTTDDFKLVPFWFGLVVKARLLADGSVAVSIERRTLIGTKHSPDGVSVTPEVLRSEFASVVQPGSVVTGNLAGFGRIAFRVQD